MKIMIIGRPGSGKSTFALELCKKLNLPLYHLDKYFYKANWVERDYVEFLADQDTLVETENWIIDGNSTKSYEMRYSKADICLYFNLPKYLCYWRSLLKTTALGMRWGVTFFLERQSRLSFDPSQEQTLFL